MKVRLILAVAVLALAMPARAGAAEPSGTPAGKAADGVRAFDRDHIGYGAFLRGSHLMDGHQMYDRIIDTYDYPTAGVEIYHNTAPGDGSWFAWAYNYPQFGFGFSVAAQNVLQFKNNSRLGTLYNIYGHMHFDFVRRRIFSFGPTLEFGPSFAAQKYHPVDNPENGYIGSTLVAVIGAGLEAKFNVTPNWQIGASLMGVHHSNGQIRVPNWGMNNLEAGVFARYSQADRFADRRSAAPVPARPDFKRWNFDVYASYGIHSCSVEMNADCKLHEDPAGRCTRYKAHSRAVIGADCIYRYHPIFGSGLVADLFYTSNTRELMEADKVLHSAEELAALGYEKYCPVYVGIAAVQEFYYGPFALHLEIGAYVFSHLGLEENPGWCYQKVGFRYYIPKAANMFLGFDMKAHKFDRSDDWEFTLGFRL